MGTGAFTSVTADRSVSVEVAGDKSALLALTAAKEGGSKTANSDEYVENAGGGEVMINLTSTAEGASGINADAETKVANLLDITNQGTQDIQVGVDDTCEYIQNIGGVFAEGPDGNTGSNGNPNFPDPDNDGDQDPGAGFSIDPVEGDSSSPVSLAPGDTVENVSLDINKSGTTYIENNSGPYTLRLFAVADGRFSQEYTGTPADN
jgi:hypothetical protein